MGLEPDGDSVGKSLGDGTQAGRDAIAGLAAAGRRRDLVGEDTDQRRTERSRELGVTHGDFGVIAARRFICIVEAARRVDATYRHAVIGKESRRSADFYRLKFRPA